MFKLQTITQVSLSIITVDKMCDSLFVNIQGSSKKTRYLWSLEDTEKYFFHILASFATRVIETSWMCVPKKKKNSYKNENTCWQLR